ncbi:hypothetical protein [Rugosimonospora africana]|uniref:Uncharacterized protein n=1 Tax=Rugosimonospora africana TaxID=556532 RepID=A0A8J3R443_9ACTN|nr:hypothetical protein [Rugosimonospora africana]GIH21532.1 hypothetical protein Raf01_97040 [Rugosimonospora africana]
MSYDLAVWEGKQPDSDEAASAVFRDLCEQYIEADVHHEPSPRIRRYAEALLARWPDIDNDEGKASPWASAPLIGEAIGPLMYFPIVYSQAEPASAFAATLAWAHGLVCYDRQLDQIRTPAIDHNEVDRLVCDGRNIRAIAKIREQLGCSLRDAVDMFNARPQVVGDIHPPRPGMPSFVLTTSTGRTITNPSPGAMHRTLTQLAPERWFAILERQDGWYLQVGYGSQAGTRPGWYALERQDGDPSKHYRTIATDLGEVITAFTAFTAFAADDPDWSRRFAWQPYQP